MHITKEHIFADWLQPLLPKETVPRGHFTRDIVGVDSEGNPKYATVRGKLNRPGGFVKQKLRIACAQCNNGWMSGLQTKAKPFLAPLIRGEDIVVGPEAKAALASWATMYAMVADHIEPSHSIVPETERRSFRSSQKPLRNWLIWIGNYPGERFSTHFFRKVSGILEDGAPFQSAVPDTQNLTFVLGRAFFHVVSSTDDHKFAWISENYGPFLKLSLIWPDTESTNADLRRLLNDADILKMRFDLNDVMTRRYKRPGEV